MDRAGCGVIPVADRLVWQMAQALEDGDVVATGVASPLAVLAIAVARATHAPRLTYLACVGALNPRVTRLHRSSEDLAYLDGRSGEITIPDLFDHARRGRVDTVFFGAAQLDGFGNTNLSAAGSLGAPTVKFPGVVGACSLRRWCKRPVIIVPRQSRRVLVPHVAVKSTVDDRRTRVLTDLGVFSVGPGGARLEAIAPHTSLDTIALSTGFPFTIADAPETVADPTASERDVIAALDPDGLRFELVGAPS